MKRRNYNDGAQEEENREQRQAELEGLQEENARLKSLLTEHGISWEKGQQESCVSESARLQPFEKPDQSLDPAEKVNLFRGIFRGRADVYSVRWESARGKSGHAPACANEWRAGGSLSLRRSGQAVSPL